MQITIAGKPADVADQITIAQLLEDQQVKNRESVTVSVNEDIYDSAQFAETVIPEGAEIELLYFMGGGAQ